MMQNKLFAVTQAVLGLVCQILGLMLASHCWVSNGHGSDNASGRRGGPGPGPGVRVTDTTAAARRAGQPEPRRRRWPDSA